MPRRRARTHQQHRISRQVIDRFLETIELGVPWRHGPHNEIIPGCGELIALVKGHHYSVTCEFWKEESDRETPILLWQALCDAILTKHCILRPGTRPAAWWCFEAPERRRVVGRGTDYPPAMEDPDLPQRLKRLYFGAPGIHDGCTYESQREFLERLNLLTDGERAIFDKHEDIALVRINAGARGACKPCWERIRKTAGKISFDVDAAEEPMEDFWVPSDLIFDCKHSDMHSGGVLEELGER